MNKSLILASMLVFSYVGYAKTEPNISRQQSTLESLNKCNKALLEEKYYQYPQAQNLILRIAQLISEINISGTSAELEKEIAQVFIDFNDFLAWVVTHEDSELQKQIEKEEQEERNKRKEDDEWHQRRAEAEKAKKMKKAQDIVKNTNYSGYVTNEQASALQKVDQKKYNAVVRQKTEEFNDKAKFDKAFDGY